jgi:hypothetical protein
MAAPTRNQIVAKLIDIVTGAYQWAEIGKKLQLWVDVSPRPYLAYFQKGPDAFTRQSETFVKRAITVHLVIYTDSSNPDVPGSIEQNNILDAIEAALKPAGADIVTGRQTMGGLVSHCYISSVDLRDPGDLDGTGILIVAVNILIP